MKNKMLFLSVVAATGMMAANSVSALPFSSFDPRSFAMGGVGVAAGTSANAVFFNPALLAAANEEEDFSVEFPIFGVRAADPDDFVDAVDTVSANDSMTAFSNAVTTYQGSPTSGNATLVQSAATLLTADLNSLSQKSVQLEGDVAFVVGVPSKKFGISIYGNAWGVGGAVADVTSTDLSAITTTVTTALALGAVTDPTTTFTSTVSARFATITEVGVAIARDFDGIAVGITPKYLEVTTNDYKFTGSEIDNADIDQSSGEKSDSDMNIDIGVAKNYDNGWKVGLAVKNLISNEYTTVLGNKLVIDPMARIGVMHETSWSTIAFDVDLTENDPGGFEDKTQYAALGMEMDIFDTAQLRVGLRHNMSDTTFKADTVSAGIGLSPFGVHLDVSAMGNSDEVGAAMQLGFRF